MLSNRFSLRGSGARPARKAPPGAYTTRGSGLPYRLGTALAFGLLTIIALGVLRGQDLLDDAYITAHYAQNIAQGYGWVWNPDAAPTDGTTAPLWTVILAAVSVLHLPFVSTVLLLNALCYAGLGVAGCRLAQNLAGPLGAVMCLICMSVLSVLLPDCVGIETPLYGFVLLATFLAWHQGRTRQAFLTASLLPLVRGEGLLLPGVLILAMILERRTRELWPAAVLSLLPFVGWELFSLWQFHALVPNSFLAKHAQTAAVSGKLDVKSFLTLVWPRVSAFWLFVAAAAGAVAARRFTTVRAMALWLVLYVIFYGRLASVPEQLWYVLPAWWLGGVLISSGIGVTLTRTVGMPVRRLVFGALCAGSTLLGLLPAPTPLEAALTPQPPHSLSDPHRAAAAYLATQPRGLVAAGAIGKVGFYSHDPVVDILGLVSPEAVPHLPGRDYAWIIVKDRPRYVFIWTMPQHGPCGYEVTCRVWQTPWFRRHYHIIWGWPSRSDNRYAILAYT